MVMSRGDVPEGYIACVSMTCQRSPLYEQRQLPAYVESAIKRFWNSLSHASKLCQPCGTYTLPGATRPKDLPATIYGSKHADGGFASAQTGFLNLDLPRQRKRKTLFQGPGTVVGYGLIVPPNPSATMRRDPGHVGVSRIQWRDSVQR